MFDGLSVLSKDEGFSMICLFSVFSVFSVFSDSDKILSESQKAQNTRKTLKEEIFSAFSVFSAIQTGLCQNIKDVETYTYLSYTISIIKLR